jgi:hypothetical protein
MRNTNSTKKTVSKRTKVLNALENGQKVTRANALSRYKVVNLRAVIADLRNNSNKNIVTSYNKKNEVVYTIA